VEGLEREVWERRSVDRWEEENVAKWTMESERVDEEEDGRRQTDRQTINSTDDVNY